MAKLIDADELLRHKTWINGPSRDSIYDVVFCDEIEDAPTVEAIPKADYENRLKADMVAMLMDLYLLFSDCQTAEECIAILNKQIADLKGRF